MKGSPRMLILPLLCLSIGYCAASKDLNEFIQIRVNKTAFHFVEETPAAFQVNDAVCLMKCIYSPSCRAITVNKAGTWIAKCGLGYIEHESRFHDNDSLGEIEVKTKFGRCPDSHPHPFKNWRYCCSTDKDWHGKKMSTKSGSCANNEQVACQNYPCMKGY